MTARMSNHSTYSRGVAGTFLWLCQSVCHMRVTFDPRSPWVRTDVWMGWGFLPDTYWVYRESRHTCLRLVYRNGRLVYYYRLLRCYPIAHNYPKVRNAAYRA